MGIRGRAEAPTSVPTSALICSPTMPAGLEGAVDSVITAAAAAGGTLATASTPRLPATLQDARAIPGCLGSNKKSQSVGAAVSVVPAAAWCRRLRVKDTLDRAFTAPGIAVDAAAPPVVRLEAAPGVGVGGCFLRNGVDDLYRSTVT